MKLICHIGTPKTATTFLQRTCGKNRDWLLDQGILYPQLLSEFDHITLLFAAHEQLLPFSQEFGLETLEELDEFRGILKRTLHEQVAAAPHAHTAIVSSENLTGNMRLPQIIALRDFLSPVFDEIEILVYLRRQDDAIVSTYAEFMRRGFNSLSLADFVTEALDPEKGPPFLFIRRTLEEWGEVFGRDKIQVRLFDRAHIVQNDILADFLAQALGPDLPDLDPVERAGFTNTSLSAPVLEFLRQLQPHLPYVRDGKLNQERHALLDRINTLPQQPRTVIGRHHSIRVMTHFAEINEWVRQTYLPHLSPDYFQPNMNLPERGNMGQLTPEASVRFAAHLLRSS